MTQITEKPVGSIRLSLKEPQDRPEPQDLPYCLIGNTPKNFTNHNNFTAPQLQCRYWDAPLVLFPPLEPAAMFVSTRVNVEMEHLEPKG